ncbi:MAG: YcxB family protein [bacterium]|nr:YcxB family protein [bacterium]
MNAAASIKCDRQYFNAFYANWIAHRSRWRRLAIPVAITFFAMAVVALFLLPSLRIIAVGIVVAAIINLVDALTYKWRWVRRRLASFAGEKTADFTFTDDAVRIKSPKSEGTIDYDGFDAISTTPDGIFLVPGHGVSVFVPRSSFTDSDAFGDVCSKLSEHAVQRSSKT